MAIETDVAVLEQKLSTTDIVLERLADSFTKISDVSNSLMRMISIHDEKFATQAVFNKDIDKAVEDIIKDNKQTYNEIVARVESHEDKVITLIEELRKELKVRDDNAETKNNQKEDKIDKRIESLEKWRWTSMGAVAVISTVIGYLLPTIIKTFIH